MEISLHDSNNESDEPKKSKEELKNRQEKTEQNKTTVGRNAGLMYRNQNK